MNFDNPFTLPHLLTLGMLIMLQAVLGFDNLLYISIESKRVEEEKQSAVRRWGIGLAIGLRLVLLVVVMVAIEKLKMPFIKIHEWKPLGENSILGNNSIFDCDMNLHGFIVLLGGVFILYTAVKEIFHMLADHDLEHEEGAQKKRSPLAAISWIVAMNLVFSFDSILSAIALTKNIFVMSAAIVISGVLMILLSDRVAKFLQKNRMYEVLGLFILLLVGVMLLGEGGHISHLAFFGFKIEPMATSTFYFVLFVLVIVDVVQSRYQKKILSQQEHLSSTDH